MSSRRSKCPSAGIYPLSTAPLQSVPHSSPGRHWCLPRSCPGRAVTQAVTLELGQTPRAVCRPGPGDLSVILPVLHYFPCWPGLEATWWPCKRIWLKNASSLAAPDTEMFSHVGLLCWWENPGQCLGHAEDSLSLQRVLQRRNRHPAQPGTQCALLLNSKVFVRSMAPPILFSLKNLYEWPTRGDQKLVMFTFFKCIEKTHCRLPPPNSLGPLTRSSHHSFHVLKQI